MIEVLIFLGIVVSCTIIGCVVGIILNRVSR